MKPTDILKIELATMTRKLTEIDLAIESMQEKRDAQAAMIAFTDAAIGAIALEDPIQADTPATITALYNAYVRPPDETTDTEAQPCP